MKPQVNSVAYWDARFREDWEARGGPDQTRFFAEVALQAMPAWLTDCWDEGAFSLADIGCAQGDANAVLGVRFPAMQFIGADVSATCLKRARKQHAGATFRKIRPDWSDLPAADYYFSSNTIEHLSDWSQRIALLCRMDCRAVVILVPYRETQLEAEHVARFDEWSFPLRCESKQLVYLRAVDTSQWPSSRWAGQQILAIYASSALAERGASPATGKRLDEGLDLRGLSDQAAAAALMDCAPAPPPPPPAPEEAAPASGIESVNQSWKLKFEEMVRDFNERHERTLADHRQLVSALESRISTSAAENQAIIKTLSDQRNEAMLQSEIAGQRLAFQQETHRLALAQLEEAAQRERELQRKSGEFDLARQKLEAEGQRAGLLSRIDLLTRDGERNEERHAAELRRLSEERDDAIRHLQQDLVQLRAEHESELAELDQRIREVSDERSRIAGELDDMRRSSSDSAARHLAEANQLSATLAQATEALAQKDTALQQSLAENQALADVRNGLVVELETVKRLHAEQMERLESERMSEVGRLNDCIARLQEDQRAADEAHRNNVLTLSEELERLRISRDADVAQLRAELIERNRAIRGLERQLTDLASDHQNAMNRQAAIGRFELDQLVEKLKASEERNVEEAAAHVDERENLRAAHELGMAEAKARINELESLCAAQERRLADAEVHIDGLNRLRAAHEHRLAEQEAAHRDSIASLDTALAAARGRVDDLEASLAALELSSQKDNEAARLQIASLETSIRQERDRVAYFDGLRLDQRAHYERHLDAMNRELDRLASEIAECVNTLANGYGGHAEEGPAATIREVNNMTRLSGQPALQRPVSGGIFARLKYVLTGRTNDDTREPPAADPEPQDISESPSARAIDFLLGSLRYERNFAGASPSSAALVDAAEDQLPLPADAVKGPPDPPPITVAMQLEAFDRGGLERVVFDLACGLAARNVPLIILCRKAGLLADEIRSRGIEVLTFAGETDYQAILEGRRITHLFAHHSYDYLEIAARFGAALFDVVHNSYFWKRDNPRPVVNAAEMAHAVICVSSQVRDFHTRLFGITSQKTRVINNPLNLDGLIVPDAMQLKRIRSGINHTTFLNVANFFPAKAQIAMVSGFAEAYRLRPEIRLLIAGSDATPEVGAALRDTINSHGLEDVVTLLGHCSRRDLSRHYANAHAFLLPSIFEGYSISAIEAATFGLPLVMTDVGGARDLIRPDGCGIILPPAIADLTSVSPADVERLGLSAVNGSTGHLRDALMEIATNRDDWFDRGLKGMSVPQSLPVVIDEYMHLIREAASPEGSVCVSGGLGRQRAEA